MQRASGPRLPAAIKRCICTVRVAKRSHCLNAWTFVIQATGLNYPSTLPIFQRYQPNRLFLPVLFLN